MYFAFRLDEGLDGVEFRPALKSLIWVAFAAAVVDPAAALQADAIGEMERLYKKTHAACEADEKLLDQARQELVKLQSGDAENLAILLMALATIFLS